MQAESVLSAFVVCKLIRLGCGWQEVKGDYQLRRAAVVIEVVGVARD
ncbi:MAG: hypothetical protein V3R87_02385 [Dehalococcoidia bacterium]